MAQARPNSSKEVGIRIIERMEARMADPRMVWGIPWAWKGLNKLTGGIHKAEMTICVARPSVGKTTFMVQQADTTTEYLGSAEGKSEYPGGKVKLVLCESTADV